MPKWIFQKNSGDQQGENVITILKFLLGSQIKGLTFFYKGVIKCTESSRLRKILKGKNATWPKTSTFEKVIPSVPTLESCSLVGIHVITILKFLLGCQFKG